MTERRLGEFWIRAHDLFILRQRFLRTAEAPQAGAQPKARLAIACPLTYRSRESLCRLAVASFRLQHYAKAVLRQEVVRRIPDNLLELFLGSSSVSHHVQRRAQPVAQCGAARR